MYEYRARIVRVIDGDTVEADIDLGFHISVRKTLRLSGINAPETRGTERPHGLAATRFLEQLIPDLTGGSNELTVCTLKDATGKYGRCLAVLLAGDRNLNEAMIEAGHAVAADY